MSSVLSEPLHIGANDLLRGVEYTHCGVIHVEYDYLFGKKWKQRYCIISKGFLYVYTSKNAKKTEHSYPLKLFESAGECDPKDGEKICFCLRYKTPQAPILFACDTADSREKWIEKFCSSISEVQSVSYDVSADSGFGSAESVPRNKSKPSSMDEYARYDEVDEELFKPSDVKSPNLPRDDESGYLSPTNFNGSNNTYKGGSYENLQQKERSTIQSNTTRKIPHGVNTDACIGELKQKFVSKHNASRTNALKNDTSSTYARPQAKEDSPPIAIASNTQSSLFGKGSMPSGTCSASPFVSVRGENVAVEESLAHLSVRGQDSLYENNDDTDNSTDSDNTSPKTIYENPEMLESVKPRKFKRKEYMCHGKEKAKKELKQKPIGVFAVFPGESAELGLCVVTPLGLKHFRIHSQNERVSLFESHQNNTQFCSLDELLAFYHDNILPRKDYSVKLERGYNTLY